MKRDLLLVLEMPASGSTMTVELVGKESSAPEDAPRSGDDGPLEISRDGSKWLVKIGISPEATEEILNAMELFPELGSAIAELLTFHGEHGDKIISRILGADWISIRQAANLLDRETSDVPVALPTERKPN